MADSRRLIRIFLASPGDVGPERRIAKDVVDDFNSVFGEHFGCQLDLVGWEDTVTVFGRPQEVINRELERCELFVGLVWKRWGSPPSAEGPFTSGFEEEFRLSVARRNANQSPEICLFFKDIDEESLKDPGEQLKRVLEFKTELVEQRLLLFETFSDGKSFQKKFHRCIARYVQRVSASIEPEGDEAKQSSLPRGEQSRAGRPQEQSLFPARAVEFISGLLEPETRQTYKAVTATEVARFRLLGTTIGEPGNDSVVIGTHDANLIYQHKGELALGPPEKVALLRAGLRAIPHENVPVWTWAFEVQNEYPWWLSVATGFGEVDERVGALTLLRLLGTRPNENEMYTREEWLTNWLVEAPNTVKVAALSYLARWGDLRDLPHIRAELGKADGGTIGPAAEALVRIVLRDEGQEAAISAINETQPALLPYHLVSETYGDGSVVSDAALVAGFAHPSVNVRKVTAALAVNRTTIETEDLNPLLKDQDAAVRSLGVQAIVSRGKRMGDRAKEIIVGQGALSGTLLGGGRSGQDEFDEYSDKTLRTLDDDALQKLAEAEGIYDRSARIAWIERNFDRFGEQLRGDVDDRFSSAFDDDFRKLTSLFEIPDDLAAQTLGLKPFVQQKFVRKALDVLGRVRDPKDIFRFRAALKNGFVPIAAGDVAFIGSFGDETDIETLIAASEGHGGLGINFASRDSLDRLVARTIYRLGRGKLAELLRRPMPPRMKALVVIESACQAFRKLEDSVLLTLMDDENERIRKAVALKSVICLPKKRLFELHSSYVASDKFRYYNVVHWLDLGVSGSRQMAVLVAEMAIRDAWPEH